eukprot:297438-Pelagomonas_calceolata.AAC.1
MKVIREGGHRVIMGLVNGGGEYRPVIMGLVNGGVEHFIMSPQAGVGACTAWHHGRLHRLAQHGVPGMFRSPPHVHNICAASWSSSDATPFPNSVDFTTLDVGDVMHVHTNAHMREQVHDISAASRSSSDVTLSPSSLDLTTLDLGEGPITSSKVKKQQAQESG